MKNILELTHTITNIPVHMVQFIKDLGASAARDLLWNSLINILVSKCNRMMGIIKCFVDYKAPITVTSHLYGALVYCNLEHCSTVF